MPPVTSTPPISLVELLATLVRQTNSPMYEAGGSRVAQVYPPGIDANTMGNGYPTMPGGESYVEPDYRHLYPMPNGFNPTFLSRVPGQTSYYPNGMQGNPYLESPGQTFPSVEERYQQEPGVIYDRGNNLDLSSIARMLVKSRR